MKTQSKFYLKKIQNEKKLMEEEYKIRNEFHTMISGQGLLSNLLKMPFLKEKNNNFQSSNNLIQDGIQLFHSVKQVTALSKNIIHQLKS